MRLRFVKYRRLDRSSTLTADERAQLEARSILVDAAGVEAVDVVLGAETVYRGYFWPFGSAVFFRAETTDVVASACQHSLDRCEDRNVWDALGRAYREADPKIREPIDFRAPVHRVDHHTLGLLEYDDRENAWRANFHVGGRIVQFWIYGELEPFERALDDARTATESFDAFSAAARRAARVADGELTDVAIWKRGLAQVVLQPTDGEQVTVEIPVAV